MNPNKRRDRETGRASGGQDNSKKLAVKELVERYYYQLTVGCGREGCCNDNCASSGRLDQLSPNEAAARALHLVMAKAALCDSTVPNHTAEPTSHTSSCRLSEPCGNRGAAAIAGSGVSGTSAGGSHQMELDLECTGCQPPILAGDSTPTKDSLQRHDKSPTISSINTTVLAASSLRDELRPQEMEIDLYCTFSDTSPLAALPKKPTVAKNTLCSQEKPASTGGATPVELAPKAPRAYRMLTEELLLGLVSECRSSGNYTPLIHALGQVFSRDKFLKRSFPRRQSPSPEEGGLTKEDLRAMEVDMDKDQDSLELEDLTAHRIGEDMFGASMAVAPLPGVELPRCAMASSSSSSSLSSARLSGHVNQDIPVDVESVRRSYDVLFSIPDLPFLDALVNAIMILCENLEIGLRYHSAYQKDPSLLSVFVVLLELPLLEGSLCGSALHALCRACALLPPEAQARLAKQWGAQCPPHRLRNTLNALHQVLTARVIEGHFGRDFGVADDELLVASIKTMKILFMANVLGGELEQCREEEDEGLGTEEGRPVPKDPAHMLKEDTLWDLLSVKVADCRKPLIPWEEFYNEPLSEQLETDRGFVHTRGGTSKEGHFSFLGHAFVLTPAVKALGLYYDNRIRMYSERHLSVIQMLVGGAPANPYLRLNVRRDHLIDDALHRLELVAMESPSSLKKQLVVEFEGEQGIDEGGVSKEFFQLVVEEIFNPDIAMFTLNGETQTYWFNPTSFESDAQFKLIGIILGLAIYNNVILDVHFPMVVYRKLLGRRGTFHDLQDWNPSLAKGLQQLLDYKGDDMEEVFVQSFRITHKDVFGTVLTHDLKENGDTILVNQDNKWEFVDMYTDFLLNKSIEKQFRAFRRGFLLVTDDSPLEMLFRPEEVELLVCGSKNFDFNALEESTEYDGYTTSSPIIRHFWELVHEFSQEQKRKLLQFATGSDRVPVGGLSKLKLVIARHGTDSERLPTAHTCFNVLLLPEYSSKEKLADRLLKAINYSKGFGMF